MNHCYIKWSRELSPHPLPTTRVRSIISVDMVCKSSILVNFFHGRDIGPSVYI